MQTKCRSFWTAYLRFVENKDFLWGSLYTLQYQDIVVLCLFLLLLFYRSTDGENRPYNTRSNIHRTLILIWYRKNPTTTSWTRRSDICMQGNDLKSLYMYYSPSTWTLQLHSTVSFICNLSQGSYIHQRHLKNLIPRGTQTTQHIVGTNHRWICHFLLRTYWSRTIWDIVWWSVLNKFRVYINFIIFKFEF